MKILINLQAGSVRVKPPGGAVYLETIEVVDPALSVPLLVGRFAVGDLFDQN
ncbi:hypothetical protein RG836_12745 [Pseudomonas sp. SZMC_28357]|uniref:hypothetical protein n=1 Tax=Pseudomonas sp. SZMC_28357 TaxID=3074380 RepID=UPI0028722F74|nr:hypothetical protein [Pseudomonas sp. SZMC_28357]MDR9752316.1 hypothetical protein [Pseudomonas sp. SZMC_28357]